MIEENIFQLGAIAVIFFFSMKEFFSYLKAKNNKNGNVESSDKARTFDRQILQELQKMNSNHLHSIEAAINVGDKEVVRAITDGNLKMIEILGEIRGSLRK